MESDDREANEEPVAKKKAISTDQPQNDNKWISKGYSAASKIRPRKVE